jgi:GT2 family glycosyltransferase
MNVIDIVIPVYNDNPYLKETLASIFAQQLPLNWILYVYVVDDGSDTAINLELPYENLSNVSIVRLDENQGRGAACNAGVRAGSGCYIYILDVDCILRKENILFSHMETIAGAQVSASCGGIYRNGDSFWAKYQNEVAQRRVTSFEYGDKSSLTTANFMIKREAFESVRGFDSGFTQYGFEDKDLLLRLINNGCEMQYCDMANVEHICDLSMISVVNKIKKSAEFSSTLFIKKHPFEYKGMPYAKADVRYSNGGARILAYIAKPILWPLIRVVSWGINKRLFPFYIAKKLVKYISGLAYLIGTKAAQDATG